METEEKLQKARIKIDKIDQVLVKSFQERMKLVEEVMEFKKQNRLPIFHGQREKEIIHRALGSLTDKDFAKEVEDFLRGIFKISRGYQARKLFSTNIALIGFMGTGKSTVGRRLSQELGIDYVDTDDLIEKRLAMPISAIFEKHGENFFRDMERQVIKEVSSLKNRIIICGGGVVLDRENVKKLRENARVLLLEAQAESIYQRIKSNDGRPLLKGQMGVRRIKELLKSRQTAYEAAAHIKIDTDKKTLDEISSEIINELYTMD